LKKEGEPQQSQAKKNNRKKRKVTAGKKGRDAEATIEQETAHLGKKEKIDLEKEEAREKQK